MLHGRACSTGWESRSGPRPRRAVASRCISPRRSRAPSPGCASRPSRGADRRKSNKIKALNGVEGRGGRVLPENRPTGNSNPPIFAVGEGRKRATRNRVATSRNSNKGYRDGSGAAVRLQPFDRLQMGRQESRPGGRRRPGRRRGAAAAPRRGRRPEERDPGRTIRRCRASDRGPERPSGQERAREGRRRRAGPGRAPRAHGRPPACRDRDRRRGGGDAPGPRARCPIRRRRWRRLGERAEHNRVPCGSAARGYPGYP